MFYAHHLALLAAASAVSLPGPPAAGLVFNASSSATQFATIQPATIDKWALCLWVKVRSAPVSTFYYLFDTRYTSDMYVLSTEMYACDLYVDGQSVSNASVRNFGIGQWQRVVIQYHQGSSLAGTIHLLASAGEGEAFHDVELGPVSLWQDPFTPAQLADSNAYPPIASLLSLWEPAPGNTTTLPRTSGTLDAILHGF